MKITEKHVRIFIVIVSSVIVTTAIVFGIYKNYQAEQNARRIQEQVKQAEKALNIYTDDIR